MAFLLKYHFLRAAIYTSKIPKETFKLILLLLRLKIEAPLRKGAFLLLVLSIGYLEGIRYSKPLKPTKQVLIKQ